jgi:hypothetical protein
MALWIEKNPATFFTVVGAAYIPEHRSTYTDQGNGQTQHESGLLAWLTRDFDANVCAAGSVEPFCFSLMAGLRALEALFCDGHLQQQGYANS